MYLIINLGLKAIRAIIFNDEGYVIYSNSLPVYTTLRGKFVEQDVNEWKKLLYRLLDEIDNTSDLLKKITYITGTTSSSCAFGYDAEFKPITKVLMVSDKRAEKEVTAIKENNIYLTKNKFEQIYCSTSSNIPKLYWIQNNEPGIYEKIKYWVGAGEFLNFEFTGEIFSDSLNASKSFYTETSQEYLSKLLSEFSITSSLLPKVKPIGSQFNIRKALVEKYNLQKNCKFVLTTYDAICAVIGSNIGESNNVCDVSGTITSVRTLTDFETNKFNENPSLLQQDIPFLKQTVIGSSNNLGGGIIEWYKQAFFDSNDKDVYFQMENEANLSQPGAKGIIFLPYLLGERSPFIDKDIRATFFGINRNTTRIDFTRAVFESTAYVTNDLLSLIKSEMVDVKSLSVSGGLARFDTINQIKSDVTNLPVHVIENFESTAVGAMILLRITLGHFESVKHAAKELVTVRKLIIPNKHNIELYKEIFQLYKDLTHYNSKLGADHSKVMQKLGTFSSTIISNL